MQYSHYQLTPEIQLDARRAVYLPQQKLLAVADLHLGYAWVQRHRGLLLPVAIHDDSVGRLQELQRDYEPAEIALLGDIVHSAVAVDALVKELKTMVQLLGNKSRLVFVLGNHDKKLIKLLTCIELAATVVREHKVGPHSLLHGDFDDCQEVQGCLAAVRASHGRIIMGHEHPATTVGDGVATAVKCPCFLVSDEVLVLPAFSNWAGGTRVDSDHSLSPLTQCIRFTQRIAVMGQRLLPITAG